MTLLDDITGFQWDDGNIDKSQIKHLITPKEAEEIFLDEKLAIENDIKHSELEKRCIAIGKTLDRKLLFCIFTVRNKYIRIISVRRANKKEHALYEEAT